MYSQFDVCNSGTELAETRREAAAPNRLRARAHRTPLPSILLANVQAKFQRDIRDCNLLCFTETWLNPAVPDHAIQPAEFFSVHRMDRTRDSGKSRGGGVCLMVNNSWCNSASVVPLARSCTPNLELLTIMCRPFYLPREFTSVIISAVYIPPQADTDTALCELHEALTQHQAQHRDAALIVAGDFNSANLKRAAPNFYQHITCPTTGPLLHYSQGRLQSTISEVTRWTDQSVAALQDALDDADWDMFRNSSNDINVFTEAVVGFIGKLADDTALKTTIRTFPNQKPWVDKTIRDALRSRTAAYNAGLASGDMVPYKAASYNVRKAVKEAKQRYGRKLESQLQQNNSRSLWQGLRTITDYKAPTSGMMNADVTLADELNTFYARFEAAAKDAKDANASGANGCRHEDTASTGNAFIISEHDVRRAFKRVNTRKAAGPDGISGRILRACADQLAPVFTEIFNLSLSQSVIPTCFKESIIVPVPKKPHPASLNDYRPVALTSVVMKCFERLVKDFIISSLPDTLDPLQFAYRPNRSTDDAISHLLHTSLTHLDTRGGNYVKMLFIDYSSAFNTIIPSTLTTKLEHLGLSSSLCQWICNFLTGRPQAVRMGGHLSASLTLSTGAPQGCVLSPLLYSLYTYDCVATTSSTTIIKFADDTVVVGLISDNNETAYLKEIRNLENWCQRNNLLLNVSKTKELIVDFSTKQERNYQTPIINESPVERVNSFKYLGVHITQDLSWSWHINTVVKKARQRLYHLRRLRDFRLPSKVLRNFYSCTIESILTGNILTWFGNSTMQDRRALQRVVRSAERTIHTELPDLHSIYSRRCWTKARKIVKDLSHPNNGLFSLMRSGKRFRSLNANTERLRRSFFPQAIRSLNQYITQY
ncbi:hypothetical protein M9458_053886 [Cirrhinus mrigala]|uniref:Reverse transcriptase domain-containing protein n=1 Tax=Cirrhinus mrigala TaxID=683832 RepID=A0ABD0MPC4_CIRMR